jgi:hypothetical protein
MVDIGPDYYVSKFDDMSLENIKDFIPNFDEFLKSALCQDRITDKSMKELLDTIRPVGRLKD